MTLKRGWFSVDNDDDGLCSDGWQVMLVRWNEPYQKLATCDVTGIIFVWIKHDGRWSIELINDRSSQVIIV